MAEELPRVELDESYFKQALLNLVQNAMNAMPEGGMLRIQTAQEGGEAVLRVSDTGVGISEENLAKIWEPFFTTKDFGSGLGLTLVFKIVKEHRGEITVRSREGEGAEFVISLPLPQEEKNLLDYAGRQERRS